ncbi:MAG: hypothetical protein J0J15_36240 [Mesorhizobium sp.]|nr:hypothetical protein [Mesorhizobium sp.]
MKRLASANACRKIDKRRKGADRGSRQGMREPIARQQHRRQPSLPEQQAALPAHCVHMPPVISTHPAKGKNRRESNGVTGYPVIALQHGIPRQRKDLETVSICHLAVAMAQPADRRQHHRRARHGFPVAFLLRKVANQLWLPCPHGLGIGALI